MPKKGKAEERPFRGHKAILNGLKLTFYSHQKYILFRGEQLCLMVKSGYSLARSMITLLRELKVLLFSFSRNVAFIYILDIKPFRDILSEVASINVSKHVFPWNVIVFSIKRCPFWIFVQVPWGIPLYLIFMLFSVRPSPFELAEQSCFWAETFLYPSRARSTNLKWLESRHFYFIYIVS